jgi:hypothetical protein
MAPSNLASHCRFIRRLHLRNHPAQTPPSPPATNPQPDPRNQQPPDYQITNKKKTAGNRPEESLKNLHEILYIDPRIS